MNHCITIVGYGTDPKLGAYWLGRNQWGNKWGENGYIRIARNARNTICIASYFMYPTGV